MGNNKKPQESKINGSRLNDELGKRLSSRSLNRSYYDSEFVGRPLTQEDLNIGADPRKFSLWGGIIMITFAALSFLIPGPQNLLPAIQVEQNYGLFLNWFPMNVFNKSEILLIGLSGLIVYKNRDKALVWSRFVTGFMGVMAILGIIPLTQMLFGYMPLSGSIAIIHFGLAIIALYFSYYGRSKFISSEHSVLSHEDIDIL